MSNSSGTEIKQNIIEKEHINLCWKVSLPTQHLLDVISSILAEEYIATAKQNPETFRNITPRLSELHGCALSGQGETK